MAGLICDLLTIYVLMIIGVAVISFFRVEPGSGLAQVQGLLRRATDPVLLPVRNAMAGATRGMPIDFSPIIVILGIRLMQGFIC